MKDEKERKSEGGGSPVALKEKLVDFDAILKQSTENEIRRNIGLAFLELLKKITL